MPVQMELARLILSETSDEQYIILREKDGARAFPIVIGSVEAFSIRRSLVGETTPRPMTHDLVVNIFQELRVEPVDVVITELREHTYFAQLRVRQDGELVAIDARPSDAIAVAVRCNPPLPIFVNESVLEQALGG